MSSTQPLTIADLKDADSPVRRLISSGPNAGRVRRSAPVVQDKEAQKLRVWYGKMPESCGRNNWTALLQGNGESYTIDRSEYPHRVRYAADCVRHIIGELSEKPFILDYDANERTLCHQCGGTGEKDGKPCHGLMFNGTAHNTKPV